MLHTRSFFFFLLLIRPGMKQVTDGNLFFLYKTSEICKIVGEKKQSYRSLQRTVSCAVPPESCCIIQTEVHPKSILRRDPSQSRGSRLHGGHILSYVSFLQMTATHRIYRF